MRVTSDATTPLTPEMRKACAHVLGALATTAEGSLLVLPQPPSQYPHYYAVIPHPRDLPYVLARLDTYPTLAVRRLWSAAGRGIA